MNERILFPDIEEALVAYLVTELAAASDSAEVTTVVPDPRPARWVRVRRDDRRRRMDREDDQGSRGPRLILDRPRVVFECYADGGAAADLAALVRAILAGASPGYIGTVWCDFIDDAGVVSEIDPATSEPRQVITADLCVRGTVLA
ncbi:hypothetical protein [Nocardia bovistercoris]|uniref:Tail terminator n=1 Tax=Nocardia bovistercoris TaxID=2785916 RepID=A0A931IB79_9NOCA|nr:hypothetical protein [Nocardia bovistercoris]MBH0777002.1 hypothetical protein [Nocardia bovistercoris]